jgi:membrane-bound lytic murein transglycosylase D
MLKRNFMKSGLFSPVLLLLVPNATAVKGEPTHPFSGGKTTLPYRNWNINDSLRQSEKAGSTVSFDVASDKTAVSEKKTLVYPEVALNKNATRFVKNYLIKEDESLGQIKLRSKSYFKLIDTILTKYGLPVELKYLAVVESDLKTTALSRVGAKGMWQLMPGTARDLGLKVSRKYDERTQVYKSTVAAAKYLKDLYAEFGDWLLVMAAYNGGPGTVYHAIKRSGSHNFWVLQSYLPEESRGHVKRFISTHYYFEGKGSIATLTKSEAVAYTKAVLQFRILQEQAKTAKDSISNNVIAVLR